MKTKRLASLAMMIAVNVVLSIIAPIKLLNFKITFEAFPILLSGIIGGPIDGLIVGTLGSFIYQLLFSGYGLTITTPLWILPHAISGLIVGLYSKRNFYTLNKSQYIGICIVSSLTVTFLNTIAIYIDAKIFEYYTFSYVFGSIFIKIIAGIILSILYSLLIPQIIKRININTK